LGELASVWVHFDAEELVRAYLRDEGSETRPTGENRYLLL
jgi:hypothetical protein